MVKPTKDSDVFKYTRKQLYEMENDFLSQFRQLSDAEAAEVMKLREEGILYSCSGPNARQMHKMRKPNKSGQGEKEMLRLLRIGKLYVKEAP
ncbi:MAG: hypothetical protein [Bacteriophage sp.]|nr:MAG: hypothetical protein [Bacteriophage sp.]